MFFDNHLPASQYSSFKMRRCFFSFYTYIISPFSRGSTAKRGGGYEISNPYKKAAYLFFDNHLPASQYSSFKMRRCFFSFYTYIISPFSRGSTAKRGGGYEISNPYKKAAYLFFDNHLPASQYSSFKMRRCFFSFYTYIISPFSRGSTAKRGGGYEISNPYKKAAYLFFDNHLPASQVLLL